MPTTEEKTAAQELETDGSVIKAKQTLVAQVAHHQKRITGIRPPLEGLKQSYDETLQRFYELRGMPLWYPYLGSGMGKGALVELADGSVKYDCICGIGVHFGHGHPALIEASLDAALQNTVMQGHLQQNVDSVELSKLLVETSGLNHCVLSTSGAMANENALKLLFQKKAPATRVLAFERCFMGRTLALSQISDKPFFRQGLPETLSVDYIPFYDWHDPAGSTKRAVAVLRKVLKRYPQQHACMCMEMVQGEAGYYPGSHAFFMALIDVLKEHEVPVFVDEIQTFGRTDKLFAFHHFQLHNVVDVVTVGKLAQVCATLYRTPFKPKPGLISQTFTASTGMIRASTAIVKSLLHEGYLGDMGKNMQLRKRFVDHLQQMANRRPGVVEGPFGCGLMIAFTPFKGDFDKVNAYLRALYDAGVIAFMAGKEPTRIRFHLPAGGITMDDIDTIARILEETLGKIR